MLGNVCTWYCFQVCTLKWVHFPKLFISSVCHRKDRHKKLSFVITIPKENAWDFPLSKLNVYSFLFPLVIRSGCQHGHFTYSITKRESPVLVRENHFLRYKIWSWNRPPWRSPRPSKLTLANRLTHNAKLLQFTLFHSQTSFVDELFLFWPVPFAIL